MNTPHHDPARVRPLCCWAFGCGLALATMVQGADSLKLIERGAWPERARGTAVAVGASGSTAYLVGDGLGLQVIGISNPAQPVLLGRLEFAGIAWGAVPAGQSVFVTHGGNGLHIVDVSNPAQPKLTGTYDTPGIAVGVALQGQYAYVADGMSLQIVDISNLAQPVGVGSIAAPNFAYDVAVQGAYAYVAGERAGLQVIDISNPAQPRQVGSVDTPGRAQSVALLGHYACVADGDQGLQVIDVSDPAAPRLVGGYNTAGISADVVTVGHYAYLADGDKNVWLFDLSTPAQPRPISAARTSDWPIGVAVAGSYLFVADSDGGLQVVDVGRPAAPVTAGTFEAGISRAIVLSGDYAYVADRRGGLHVLDVADPTHLREVGSLAVVGEAYGVAVDGDYAYLANYDGGLRVVDISRPTQPTTVGSAALNGFAYGVAASGGIICLANWPNGLDVHDGSNPAQPARVGRTTGFGSGSGVVLVGTHAFVAAGAAGLQVVDVSRPAQPVRLGSLDTPGDAQGVVVEGNTAYVADGQSGVLIIDVQNRNQPVRLGSFDTPGYAYGVALGGSDLFVADASSLLVLDVSNRTQPRRLGSLDLAGPATGVAVSGEYVYAARGRQGVVAVQIVRLPRIDVQPLSQAVASGSSVTFVVEASGPGPLSYQWFFNGAAIPGATDSRYTVPRAWAETQGTYSATVTNPAGTVPSSAAQLTVLLPEVRLAATSDDTGTSVPEGGSLRLAEGEELDFEARVVVDETVRTVSFQWFKDGQPYGDARIEDQPWSTSWGPGPLPTEWWRGTLRLMPAGLADAGQYSVTATIEFWAPKPPALFHTDAIVVEVAPRPVVTAEPAAPLRGRPVTLRVTLPGATPLSGIEWIGPEGLIPGQSAATLSLAQAEFADAGDYSAVVLHPDLGRPVGSAAYRLRIYPAVTSPEIVTQPRSQTGAPGGRAVFAVGASGGLPLRYQWQKNQADVPGATEFFLALPNLGPADAANYRVRVSNDSGSALSETVTLALQNPPPPNPTADAFVAAGRTALTRHTKADLDQAAASFAAAAHAAPQHAAANLLLGVARIFNFAHQPAANQLLDRLQVLAERRDLYAWSAEPLFDGDRLVSPPGVDAAEFTAFLHGQALPELRAAGDTLARVGPADFVLPLTRAETALAAVTVDAGDVHVLRAGLRLCEALIRSAKGLNLSAQLTAIQAVAEDPRTTVEAIARDYPDLLTFSDASQAVSARAALQEAVDLYVQAAGLIRSRGPAVRRLFELEPGQHGDEEQFRQGALDLKASLQRAVIVNQDPEWRIHLGPVADGTRSPRSLAPRFIGNAPDATTTPQPAFAGAVASAGKPRILFPLVDRTARPGARVELGVLAMGEDPLRYQWFKDKQLIAPQGEATYVIPALGNADAGLYEVVVSNTQGTARSQAHVALGLEPGLAVQPRPQSTAAGRPVQLRVEAFGSSPLQFQWYRNGVAIAGATGATLLLGDPRPEDAGTYAVRVSNGAGTVLSQTATVTVDSVPGQFVAPLFAEEYDENSVIFGPSRTVHDGAGHVYTYFQPLDMVDGLQPGGPLRLNEDDLSPDPTFTLAAPFPDAQAVAVQPDGRVLVAGTRHDACALVRFESDGTEDPAFHAPAFDRGIRFINVQPDGTILVTVTGSEYLNPNAWAFPTPALVRLLPDGRRDPSFVEPQFDAAGMLYVPPVRDAAGRIYVGGAFTSVNGTPRYNLARLLPDGRLDPAFAGLSGIAAGVRSTQVRGIGLQSDGRVVVAGDFRIPASAPTSERCGALRFHPDGTFDPSFVRARLLDMGIGAPGVRPRALVMLPDDRFVVVANTVVRLQPDGAMDPSFARPLFGQEALWLSRSADGRLFVPGVLSVNGEAVGGLAVFDSEGNRIESVLAGGFGRADYPDSLAVLDRGRVAVAGAFNRAGGRPRLSVAILEADGRPALRQIEVRDHPWDLNAWAKVAPGPYGTFHLLLAHQSGEKELKRFTANAVEDTRFQPDPNMPLATVTDLFGEPGGGLTLLSGGKPQSAVDGTFAQRLGPDGALDQSFRGPSGGLLDALRRVSRGPANSLEMIEVGDLRILARDSAGRYLAALNTINAGEVRLVRLLEDGREDPAFLAGTVDARSREMFDWSEVWDPVAGQWLQPPNGTIAFADPILVAAAELPGGRILAAGRFTRYNGVTAPGLVRLAADGTVDGGFHLASGARIPESVAAMPRLESLAVDAAGSVYLAGMFSEFNGRAAPGLARLLPDGTVDPTFTPPIRRVDYGWTSAKLQAADGRLFVTGPFAGPSEHLPRALWQLSLGGPPVLVDLPPSNVVGSLGGTVVLKVVASGDGPLAYQWSRDGSALPGATGPELRLESLTLADAGRYSVEVRNASGATLSPTTTLRVIPALSGDSIGFAGNAPQLALSVLPGVRVVVEASNDLGVWNTIVDTTPAGATLVITDLAGQGTPYRFYRAAFFVP